MHSELLKDPIGVLTALAITTSCVNERQTQVVHNIILTKFFSLTEGAILTSDLKWGTDLAQKANIPGYSVVLKLGKTNQTFGSEAWLQTHDKYYKGNTDSVAF